MPRNGWGETVPEWSRVRFAIFTLLAFAACILLLIAAGICAAVHYHLLQILLGAGCIGVIALWFRVAERWSARPRDL